MRINQLELSTLIAELTYFQNAEPASDKQIRMIKGISYKTSFWHDIDRLTFFGVKLTKNEATNLISLIQNGEEIEVKELAQKFIARDSFITSMFGIEGGEK